MLDALDIHEFVTGKAAYSETVTRLTHQNLRRMTAELYDRLDDLCAGLNDAIVTFRPRDPTLGGEEGFTLGRVIVHLTATCEEGAARASTLARGANADGRSRYEVDWVQVTAAEQIRHRLQESRRITLAFLNTWPDEPHLECTVKPIPRMGAMNALGIHALGLMHGKDHLEQLAEIIRQSQG